MDFSKPGEYQLNITPMKAYDRFEPNDNIQLAKIISAGEPIKGHVMDDADADYYKFRTSSKKSTVVVSIDNPSTTLRPNLALFDANKHRLWGNNGYYRTPGQDLEHSFAAEADSVYYLAVSGYQSTGSYLLKVSENSGDLSAK